MKIEQVYDEYVEKVYKFFYINTFNKEISEDLTSQTFLNFLEKASQPDLEILDAKKYLYGVMRKTWLTHLREKYRKVEIAIEDIDDFSEYVSSEVDSFETQETAQRAKKYIDMLPAKQRQILTMRLIEKHSLAEIAQTLNKNMNYVKTTQKRGIKTLKRMLANPEQTLLIKEVN